MIDIRGLDKAAVLCALYNNARPQGLGFPQFTPESLGIEEARRQLDCGPYFDYLNGRVMKVVLDGEQFEEWLYDRDNGQGAAARAVDSIRSAA